INDTLYHAVAHHLYGSAAEPAEHDSIEGLDFFDKVINVDQSPIGRTPRSNPATYTGLFTPIRDLFAGVPESRARGYGPGRFSFNVKGGRCEACQGDGLINRGADPPHRGCAALRHGDGLLAPCCSSPRRSRRRWASDAPVAAPRPP